MFRRVYVREVLYSPQFTLPPRTEQTICLWKAEQVRNGASVPLRAFFIALSEWQQCDTAQEEERNSHIYNGEHWQEKHEQHIICFKAQGEQCGIGRGRPVLPLK